MDHQKMSIDDLLSIGFDVTVCNVERIVEDTPVKKRRMKLEWIYEFIALCIKTEWFTFFISTTLSKWTKHQHHTHPVMYAENTMRAWPILVTYSWLTRLECISTSHADFVSCVESWLPRSSLSTFIEKSSLVFVEDSPLSNDVISARFSI